MGSKKNEMLSKNVSEAHSAYNSVSQCRQMLPPTSVCQGTETASTPVPKSNKEKSVTKGMLTPESLSLHDRTVYSAETERFSYVQGESKKRAIINNRFSDNIQGMFGYIW